MRSGSTAASVVVFSTIAIVALTGSAPRKRSVELEITLPRGGVPRVIVPEGEGAIVRLPDGTRFGFVATIRDREEASVVVAIWDVDRVPTRHLGDVDVMIGGPAVASDTTPLFSVRVPRVIRPK